MGWSFNPSLTLDIFYFYMYTKFCDSFFSRTEDMIKGVEIENESP